MVNVPNRAGIALGSKDFGNLIQLPIQAGREHGIAPYSVLAFGVRRAASIHWTKIASTSKRLSLAPQATKSDTIKKGRFRDRP